MILLDLLYRLRELGIHIQLVNDQLKICGPEEKLTPGLIDKIKDKKADIIDFLKRNVQKRVEHVSIEPAEEKEYYPLTPAQKRLYILQQMDADNLSYNMPYKYILSVSEDIDLDITKLEEVFKRLIARHDSLRTSFEMIDEEPVQKIHEDFNFKIEYFLATEDTENTETHHSSFIIHHSFIHPFDLSRAPLLRVGLIKERQSRYILMIDMHHIITDGISENILAAEFMSLYAGKEIPYLKIQYKDYSQWQKSQVLKEEFKKKEKYWLQEFEGEIPVLNIPIDYPRPTIQSFEGSEVNFELNGEETKALNEMARTEGTTLFVVLLAVFNIFLSKLSSQEDIIVGTPTAGRKHPDLQQIIGMFINTLALRDYPSGKRTFTRFLSEVAKHTLEAFENQDYPFEDLVEHTAVVRDMSRNPLFDVMFILQNMADASVHTAEQEMHGLKLKPAVYDITTSKFDLTLGVDEIGEELHCSFNYCTQLFKKETILEFTQYFKKIISAVIENPGNKLSEIEIITGEEKNRILYQFNDTNALYPNNQLIHELFEDQVVKSPDSIAVVEACHAVRITYRELNRTANRLAGVLRKKGVQPQAILAIMVERSVEMIGGILGILKAGGAYLPIDPEYPEDRKAYLLKDSKARILLTTSHIKNIHKNKFSSLNHLSIIPLDAEIIYPGHTDNIKTSGKPNHLAYVIYTSGSTGKPKGVIIEHRSLVNRLNWMQKAYPLDKDDTILHKTPFTFDVSVWEIFWWSFIGAKLCLLAPGGEKEPAIIIDTIENNNVTVIHFVPSMLSTFLEYLQGTRQAKKLSCLKQVIASGEALTLSCVKRFGEILHKESSTQLANLYGPTEATIDVSYYNCFESETGEPECIPIGKPIDNIRLFIMDNHWHIQPVGVAGELCISGEGLARGYLNRPGLTAEKFNHDLWDLQDYHDVYHRSYRSYSSYILYRTGDLARWLADGNIEFLGRIDHQVKIRGFRIEPGEIESYLLSHGSIAEAVVLAKENDKKDKYLCAYVTADRELSLAELREFLSASLPDYMIPSYLVNLNKMPLTPNGKIDRKALPEPEVKIGNEYTPPGNEVEEKLVETWSEILGINRDLIGINTNFFDLGGNSLKAMLMTLKIHRVFNVIITMARVFKTPRIRALAQYIESAMGNRFTSVDAAEKKEYYAVSSAQKRLYLLQQRDLKNITYNMPLLFVSEQEPDKKRLEQSFSDLIHRHESLRTSFAMIKGELVQKIHKTVDFLIEYDEGASPDAENIIKNFVRAFDLSQPPLLRVGLINAADKKQILMVDMHHIITDAVSEAILTQDFIMLYAKKQLPPLKLQYKDFSEWQTRFWSSGQLKKQEKYWLNQLQDNIPTTNLPIDYNYLHTSPGAREEGRNVSFIVEKPLARKLYEALKQTGTTLYMLLLAVYNVLLFKYTRQEDIIVGSPITGRRHADLQDIIGMFVNMIAMRNRPQKRKTFNQFLQEVKKNVVDAFDNQDYQFDELVNQLGIEEGAGGNPIFNTVLAMQNVETGAKNIVPPGDSNPLKLHPYEFESRISRFDFTLFAEEINAEIHLQYRYSTALFHEETIKKIGKHYMEILEQVTKTPGIRLEEITLSSELLAGSHTLEDQEVDFNF